MAAISREVLATRPASARGRAASRTQGDKGLRRALAVVRDISDAGAHTPDPERIIAIALDKILEVTGFRRGGIYLLHVLTQELTLEAALGLSNQQVQAVRLIRVGEGITGQTAATGHSALISCGDDDLWAGLLAAEHQHDCAVLCIPLTWGHRVEGVLNVINEPGRPFAEWHVDFLSHVGEQIGTAIYGAHELKTTLARNQQLATISHINKAISASLDIDEVYRIVTGQLGGLIPFDRVSLILWEGEGGAGFRVTEIPGPFFTRTGLLDGPSVLQEALRHPSPQMVRNHAESPFVEHRHLLAHGFASSLRLPLLSGSRVLGFLYFISREPNAYSQRHLETSEPISEQVAIAVQNAQLFQAVKQNVAEIARLKDFNENIIEGVEEGIIIENLAGRVIFVNRRLEEMTGHSRQELLGEPSAHIISPRYADKVAEESRKGMQGVKSRYEAVLLCDHQREIPVLVSTSPLIEGGKCHGALSVLTDISELKGAEQELAAAHDRLAQANQQLSLLLRRTVDAQEEERRRVATDIHDELLQSIIGALYQAQIAQQRLEDGDPAAVQSITTARDILDFVTRETRRLIFDLRPLSLDEMGLVPALRKYLSDYEDTWHIHGRLRVGGTVRRLPITRETVVFRVVQESLNNVRKHAETDSVRISLHFGREQLVVTVRDAGRGFDVHEIRGAPGHNLGLIGMRERVQSIGGQVNIQSSPGVGTRITFRVPLEPEAV